jgi:hypothetical protein
MKKANKKVVKSAKKIVVINNDAKISTIVETIEEKAIVVPVEKVKKEKVEKNGTCKQIVAFLTDLIESNQFDQKQLAKIACESIENVNPVTVTTLLVDSKNPKYNKFPHLVVKTENNTLKFA